MRLAMPVHNQRISPVLDTARTLHVYDSDSSTSDAEEMIIDLTGHESHRRVEVIAEAGVDVLICGALSRQLASGLRRKKIRIIPWISGLPCTVVQAFFENKLHSDSFSMPGCRHRRGVKRGQRNCRGYRNRNGGTHR